jgi:hypothetical protein
MQRVCIDLASYEENPVCPWRSTPTALALARLLVTFTFIRERTYPRIYTEETSMKSSCIASFNTKQFSYIQMVVGIVLAFTGNEMIGHHAVGTGLLLMITAIACAFSAALNLVRESNSARSRSPRSIKTRAVSGTGTATTSDLFIF